MAEALTNSVIRKAQVIQTCPICDSPLLKWKCITCEIFMCDNCKVNAHAKFTCKSTKVHNVIDIKDAKLSGSSNQPIVDLGHIPCKEHEKQFCCVHCMTCEKLICPKCLTSSHKGHDVADIETTYEERLEYLRNHGTTNLNPRAMTFIFGSLEELQLSCQSKDMIKIVGTYDTECPSFNRHIIHGKNSIWISGFKIRLRLYELEIGDSTLSFKNEYKNTAVYDFAMSSAGTLLFTRYADTRLFSLKDNVSNKMEGLHDFKPLQPRAVFAKDGRIIVSTKDNGISFPLNNYSRRQVVVLDSNGKKRLQIETDRQNKRMFSLVYRIAVNSENDIIVVDGLSLSTGRVVCLRNETLRWSYDGNPEINNEQNVFNPLDIATTSAGNIIVADEKNNALHMLSNAGVVLKCCVTTALNIISPISLDIDSYGRLSVGCRRDSKIYVLELKGC